MGVALGYFMKESGEKFAQTEKNEKSQEVYVPYEFLSQNADDLVGGKYRRGSIQYIVSHLSAGY